MTHATRMPDDALSLPADAPRSADARYDVTVVRGLGEARARAERELEDAGMTLPLAQQARWGLARGVRDGWLFRVTGPAGEPAGAFAAELSPSRNLPGPLLARVHRFAALARTARRAGRVLRVYLELCSPSAETHAWTAAAAARAGFAPAPEPHGYAHTVTVDLAPDEATILAGFHATARRHIRAVAKHPVALRVLDDERLVPRMEELTRETLARTGGVHRPVDWHAVLRTGRDHPGRLRAVGLFHTEVEGPASLVAFTVGHHHGHYASYEEGASTRETTLKAALVYPLLWDLMCWARRGGARAFDLSGITAGTHDSGDPLGGISDFKRLFSTTVVHVGAEWVLEPNPVSAALARLLRSGRAWAGRLASRG